jgi:hypothetical protein
VFRPILEYSRAMRWTMLEKVLRVVALWDRHCITTKFLWWPIWTGCLVPYSDLAPWLFR